MRVILAILLALGALGIVSAPAQASPNGSPSTVVYWDGAHAPGLNTACGAGERTRFIVHLWAQKGERILGFVNVKLRLKSGVDKYGNGERISKRHVKFVVRAGRYARVDKVHKRETYAYPVDISEGASPWLYLVRQCVSVAS